MSESLPLPGRFVEDPQCQANWETIQRQFPAAGTLLGTLGTARGAKIQVGTTTGLTMPVGVTVVGVPLTVAWPTAHLFFSAGVSPATHFTYSLPVTGVPNGLSQGNVVVNNTGALQTFSAIWLSIGI